MQFVSLKWLAILSVATAWTIFFSLFNRPGVRGWRNLGWLACYSIAIVMLFALPWRSSLVTWSLLGIGSGLLYFAYELFGYFRAGSQPGSKPRVTTILNGLFLWPIMLPEVIEYWLADLGVLKAETPPPPPEQT
jgi:hypothetical protein